MYVCEKSETISENEKVAIVLFVLRSKHVSSSLFGYYSLDQTIQNFRVPFVVVDPDMKFRFVA